ncbi:MAG: S41 family peptidase [Bacteroidota bacterium]
MDGVWIQEGYGRILSIKDATYTYFNTTENACLPLIENGILTDRFTVVGFEKDRLVLNPGGIVNYQFQKSDRLPEKCVNQNVKLDHSPERNFNILWNTFNQHYAFFEQRHIDWDKVKTQSESKLKGVQSDQDLYYLFSNILQSFNDGHIRLDVPDSLRETNITSKRQGPRRSKKEIIKGITTTYINQPKSYNDGVIQWGILKGKKIGYIVITDMNDFSNYVPDQDLTTEEFAQAYEKVLTSRPAIIQLQDELKGVDFIMEMILSDLSNTESVIIDLRFNGGGYETVALRLLSHFVQEPKHVLSIKAKKVNKYKNEQEYILTPTKHPYAGKVAVLTSHYSASATEIFALGTMAYPEIERFGSETNGIFSEILWKNLPNGWEFSLSNEVYSDPNGNIYEIRGVPPNYKIDYPENRFDFYNSFYEGNEYKDIGIDTISVRYKTEYK